MEIAAENIRAIQAIHGSVILEEMGVFAVADRVVEHFLTGLLPLGSGPAGERLDRYWKGRALRLDEATRRRIYRRTVGMSPGGDSDPTANREFEGLWLRFVSAVSQLARQAGPGALDEAREARLDLAENLTVHGWGGVTVAAARLANEVRETVDLLSDTEICQAYGARDMWQVVERVSHLHLGIVSNVSRQRARLEAGNRIFEWLAGSACVPEPDLADKSLVNAVESWLAIQVETGEPGRPRNRQNPMMRRMRERLLKLVRSAPLRLVIGIAFLLGAVVAREILLGFLRMATGLRRPPPLWLASGTSTAADASNIAYAWVGATVMIALGLSAYRLFVKWLEKRQPGEVARPFTKELLLGILLGLGVVFAVAGILALGGVFRVIGFSSWFAMLAPLAAAATAAVMEELILRGLLFRILEEWLGSWLALSLTALLFGALHASNPGATAWSTLAVALSGGVTLAAAFILTRRLWLAMGIHFGVNAAQGAILGIPVSGRQTVGWLRSELAGHPLWTGGSFGLEGSLVMLLLGALLGGVFLMLAWRGGRILRRA